MILTAANRHLRNRTDNISLISLKKNLVKGRQAAGLFVLVALFAACQSTPKSMPTVIGKPGNAEGQWRGKALVKNWRSGKNAVLDLDILAREPKQLRMEILGSFGVHVASIAMSGPDATYILTQEKRFVAAPADAESLTRLIPVRIPPDALLAVLFDRDLAPADWKCDSDKTTGLVSFCAHRNGEVAVKWLERTGRNRRMKISAKDADIEMVLDEAKSKVELNDAAFTLSAPSGYKQERLTRN